MQPNVNQMLDIMELDNYPMLVEYAGGGQDVFTSPYDIPNGSDFYVLEVKFYPEGRTIAGSNNTIH